MERFLISGHGFSAEVTNSFGADILSLKYDGEHVLVPLNSESEREENPYLHGAPLLLPANRLVNGRFSFMGKNYTMPINEESTSCHIHGFLWQKEFRVISKKDSEIVMEYENHGEIYPFCFHVLVKYFIDNTGFHSEYVIKNLEHGKMPLTFALHTTFVEPDFFKVPIDECQEREENCVPTGRYTPLNELQQSYKEGTYSKDNRVFGYYTSSGSRAQIGKFEYRVSDNFDYWIVYNAFGKGGFLCVEPQCGEVNGLNGKCRVLEAGESICFSTSISEKI